MTHGITMMLIGRRHLVMAAVSLMMLRRWYNGPIRLFADDAAWQYAGRLVAELVERPVSVHRFAVHKQRRHTGYGNKPRLPALSPYDRTLQLDADTLVVGPVGPEQEIWPRNPGELVLTQYSDWLSTGRIVSGRIKRWLDALPTLAEKQLASPYPAVNTGVMSYGRDCVTARRDWLTATKLNAESFISDEIAMQLIYPEVANTRMLGDRWNWSALFGVAQQDIRVVHGHGAKFFKRRRGLKVWWPRFREAVRTNFAGLADWWREDENKHLRRFVKDNPGALDDGFDLDKAVVVQQDKANEKPIPEELLP